MNLVSTQSINQDQGAQVKGSRGRGSHIEGDMGTQVQRTVGHIYMKRGQGGML